MNQNIKFNSFAKNNLYITERMLASNGNHVERTIDAVLMAGDTPPTNMEINQNVSSQQQNPSGRPAGSSRRDDRYRGRRTKLPLDFLMVSLTLLLKVFFTFR